MVAKAYPKTRYKVYISSLSLFSLYDNQFPCTRFSLLIATHSQQVKTGFSGLHGRGQSRHGLEAGKLSIPRYFWAVARFREVPELQLQLPCIAPSTVEYKLPNLGGD